MVNFRRDIYLIHVPTIYHNVICSNYLRTWDILTLHFDFCLQYVFRSIKKSLNVITHMLSVWWLYIFICFTAFSILSLNKIYFHIYDYLPSMCFLKSTSSLWDGLSFLLKSLFVKFSLNSSPINNVFCIKMSCSVFLSFQLFPFKQHFDILFVEGLVFL